MKKKLFLGAISTILLSAALFSGTTVFAKAYPFLDVTYSDSMEYATLTIEDDMGAIITQSTSRSPATELSHYTLIEGNSYFYFVHSGMITAYDYASGNPVWTNYDFSGCALSNCAAVTSDDTLYISGYYGPDFFAVNSNGDTVMRVDSIYSDAQWPSFMTLLGDGTVDITVTETSSFNDVIRNFDPALYWGRMDGVSTDSRIGTTMKVTNCNEYITLRRLPNTSSDPIMTISLGEEVTFLYESTNGFYCVDFGGSVGYALSDYLTTGASKKPTKTDAGYTPNMILWVANCKEYITLRTSPNTAASAITTIPLHDTVSYISDAGNGFFYVEYCGNYGYVLSQYLAVADGTPVVTYDTMSGSSMWVANCKEYITLRTSPSTSASAITTIPLGSEVIYCGNADNGFYYVQYGSSHGYVLSQYLSTTYSSAPSYSSPSSGTYLRVVNCNEYITLRSAPDTSASAITTMPLGATPTFISNAGNGFYYVEYYGMYGYALSSYLAVY